MNETADSFMKSGNSANFKSAFNRNRSSFIERKQSAQKDKSLRSSLEKNNRLIQRTSSVIDAYNDPVV